MCCVLWNLSVKDLRNRDTSLVRTLYVVVPRVSTIERFHCVCMWFCVHVGCSWGEEGSSD